MAGEKFWEGNVFKVTFTEEQMEILEELASMDPPQEGEILALSNDKSTGKLNILEHRNGNVTATILLNRHGGVEFLNAFFDHDHTELRLSRLPKYQKVFDILLNLADEITEKLHKYS
jgi:hypothetical protein